MNAARQTYIAGASPPGTPYPGVEWTIKCQIGFFWLDDSHEKTINCTGTNWTTLPVTCQGNLLNFDSNSILKCTMKHWGTEGGRGDPTPPPPRNVKKKKKKGDKEGGRGKKTEKGGRKRKKERKRRKERKKEEKKRIK